MASPKASAWASVVTVALAPLSGSLTTRSMAFDANVLTLDIATAEPGLAGRIGDALRSAGVDAQVGDAPDGSIRITAATT